MARADHYAILLAINYYPGLRDLCGPENDIGAFEEWLAQPDGGDLPPANIRVIKSSTFAKVVDPGDANPTETEFKRALNTLVKDETRSWRTRAGERLYVYMAGHGFTAGAAITDPALFSAVAQNGDTAHIAGYRYAAKLATAGFFDEIVLVMDCCQDVLKASLVLEPTWSPPDRNKAAYVKLLQAYGAPRGQAAYERDDEKGKKRGLFSRVLIQALKTALPDDQGFVTGQTLKNQFLQLWGDQYRRETGYDPPILPPAGVDIRLCRRGPNAAQALPPVLFTVRPPVPADGVLQISGGGGTLLQIPVTGLGPQHLAPGLYKAVLSGTERTRLFEVTGTGSPPVDL